MSNITEFFNVEEDEQEIAIVEPIVHSPDIKSNTLNDYQATRDSMKTMITKGTEMMDSLINVAKESESPRAYEVLSGYMKTIADMNKSLMEIHKDVKDITEQKEEPTKEETNNYVFVGSTEDLQKELDSN